MSDDLREKIARAAYDNAFGRSRLWLEWDEVDAEGRSSFYDTADAVLAVLPSEGWEQVGWYHKHLGTLMPLHKPQGWANDREPVYRRVDGAAPPEPERRQPVSGEFEQMYDDAVAAGVDPVEAALDVLDAAYPMPAAVPEGDE